MTKTWVKLALIGMICASGAFADHKAGHEGKGMSMGGTIEGGWALNFTTGASSSHFILDAATMNMTYEVSDKLKVVVGNAFAVGDGGGLAGGAAANSAVYFSGARLTSTNAAPGTAFAFANNAAYLEHKCADGLTTAVGHFMMPFGMESLTSRFDSATYYYSGAYTNANTLGYTYDVGFKFTLTDYIPGTTEIAIVDGHRANIAGENKTPAEAIRWWYEMKSGDMTFTPVVSAYFGRGADNLGLSGGGMLKSGAWWANAEFVYTSQKTAATAKTWSVYAEPGFDLGMANFSAKWQLNNNGTNSDMDIGVGLTKNYSDKLRVRLLYDFMNVSKKLAAASSHDVRLLLGAKW